MSKYVVALYMRLSIDDKKVDSMSIETQRDMLRMFADSIDEENVEVLEFVDNGYSGTNFERPAIQELLNLVQTLKINCIIVKDFSRFGRNSLEVGYFTQQVFPLFNVRFIAVSDNFDSNEHIGDTGGMNIAFKYLVNEYYSRDLSVKSKSAKYMKMRNGEYKSGTYCYGYKPDKDGNMVIDDDVSDVVKLIFTRSAEGKTLLEIIKELYGKGIPSPGIYKSLKGNNTYDVNRCNPWQRSTISRILSDEQYLGTFVMCKQTVCDVGSRHMRKKDKSEWIKIPNHHQSIISQELFDKVQNRRQFHLQGKRKTHEYPLKSKVICGCCNHTMQKHNLLVPVFRCNYSKHDENSPCYEMSVKEGEIELALFEIISKQAEVISNIDSINFLDKIQLQNEKTLEIEKQIQYCNDEKQKLYEQLLMCEIDIDTYNLKKSKCTEKLNALKHQHKISSDQTEKLRIDNTTKSELIKMAKDIKKETTLTKAIADILIDKVYVSPDNRIEIKWKIQDFSL